jgi:chemotaxis protein CheD
MLDELIKGGSSKVHLDAKIFGGAQMFSFITPESTLNIGQKNVEMAKTVLAELEIKIIAQETGGTFGRTITLNLDNGKVLVNTVSWGEKEV